MKVRRLHYNTKEILEVDTVELMSLGMYTLDHTGKLEDLEAQINYLATVVAALIDRAGLTDEEKLEITQTQWRLRLDTTDEGETE